MEKSVEKSVSRCGWDKIFSGWPMRIGWQFYFLKSSVIHQEDERCTSLDLRSCLSFFLCTSMKFIFKILAFCCYSLQDYEQLNSTLFYLCIPHHSSLCLKQVCYRVGKSTWPPGTRNQDLSHTMWAAMHHCWPLRWLVCAQALEVLCLPL